MPKPIGQRYLPPLSFALCAVLLLTACGGTGSSIDPTADREGLPTATTGSPPASPDASAGAASPTPRASQSADVVRSASVERDGIRVTMTFDANPLTGGEPTWVTTEVRNVGTDPVIWFHDGCAIAVDVRGQMPDVVWRLGREQSGIAADFKRLALEQQSIDQGVGHIAFTPERFIGRGLDGCDDVGITDRIAPGEAIRQRSQWDGMVQLRLGVPPSGAVDLIGRAGYYWRERGGEPADITDKVIELHLDGEIAGGRDRSLLDPPEAIDAALADQAFLAWLADKVIGDGNTPVVWFEPETNAWQIGLLDYGADRFHLVSVDPRSGSVLDTAERPWDPAVDGSGR